MTVSDNKNDINSLQFELKKNQLLQELNKIEEGLVIISGKRDINFVLMYYASFQSKHSLISLDVLNYDDITSNLRKIFEANFKTIYFFSDSGIITSKINQEINNNIINCELMISSGTSGIEKVVVWNKKKLLKHVDRINKEFNVDKNVSELIIMPLSHSFGLMRLRCSIKRGSDIYIASSLTDFKLVNKSIKKSKNIFIGGVVSGLEMFFDIYKELLNKSKSNFWFESGSMKMSKELLKKIMNFKKTNKLSFKHHYGSTEFTRFSIIDYKDLLQNKNLILKEKRNDFIVNKSQLYINAYGWFSGYLNLNGLNIVYDIINNKQNYIKTNDIVSKTKYGYKFDYRSNEIININGVKFNCLNLEKESLINFPEINDILILQNKNDKGLIILIEIEKVNDKISNTLKKFFLNLTGTIPIIKIIDKILYTNSSKKIRSYKKYEI